MQPTLCSRCHKNVAVIFIQKMEGGTTKSEGLCLKCAKEMGIKPVEDMMQKMGISDEDLEGLTNEMMSAFGGAEGMEGLMSAEEADEDEEDEEGDVSIFEDEGDDEDDFVSEVDEEDDDFADISDDFKFDSLFDDDEDDGRDE